MANNNLSHNVACALHHQPPPQQQQHQLTLSKDNKKETRTVNVCSFNTLNQHWYCDRIKITEFSYTWKIGKFASFHGEAVSPEFTSSSLNDEGQKIKWQLSITKIEKILILKLKLVCSDQSRTKFKFKTSILNGNGDIAHNIGRDNFYVASPNDVFIFPRPIEMEELQNSTKGLLLNDTLTLHCHINVVTDLIVISPLEFLDIPMDNSQLYSDMLKLLETGKFSDITLVMDGGRELKAHKNILSMRSEVFAAMFEHQLLEENTLNRVYINDLDFEVVGEMLTFIYSNKAPNISKYAEDLLMAADKYALRNLKLMCEVFLDRDRTIDTALSTLVLADRHKSELLRLRTIHFIKANLTKVIQTKEWSIMQRDYPQIIDEIERYNGCI